MVDVSGLALSPLFAGLAEEDLRLIAERARQRTFAAGEPLCRAGEPSECCWVITAGLVDVIADGDGGSGGEILARHRKGASVGEVGVILREPQRETVVASIPTSALELGAADLGELVRRYPAILINILRAVDGRLLHARARRAEQRLGETVVIASGASAPTVQARLLAGARIVSPRSVTSVDRTFSFAGALTAADDLVAAHATVMLPAELDAQTLVAHLREADRVIAIAADASEAEQLGRLRREAAPRADVEVVLIGEDALAVSRSWGSDVPARVVRACQADARGELSEADLGWLTRHVTRTKLGLALGAGGAKGYAHIGVLQVLEEAGYEIDFVAGSSIGAIIAAYLAMGADAAQIDATLRDAFDAAAVGEIFTVSLAGRGGGLDVMTRLLRETTGERTFADTRIPLTIMAVDLSARAPAPLRDGLLWEALLAATALAGVFPPYERDGHRLVDGLALVPVPTGALIDDGADVTVSVNLIGHETLPNWPGGPPPEPPAERRRNRVLDNLLEVMDLSQLADSVRHAESADVAVTPLFGPGEWRDFHLADQFLAAGRAAAEEQLPAIRSLAIPAGAQATK